MLNRISHSRSTKLQKEMIVYDVERMSLNWNVITRFEPVISVYRGQDYWTSTNVTLVDRGFIVKGSMYFELDSLDRENRLWSNKIFFIPETAVRENYELHLPKLVQTGYQILIKGKYVDANLLPLIRIDSICITSMIDGHRASGGDLELGCECDGQRKNAMREIHSHGGISILSPFEGRGNGIKAHAGQIQIQNYAKRHALNIPDTYEAVKLLGYPKDRRPNFYWLDAMMLRMVTDANTVKLYSNNPEKILSVERLGITVLSNSLFDEGSSVYYQGVNFQAKIAEGKHTSFNKP